MKILFLNYIDNGDIWKGFDNKNNKNLVTVVLLGCQEIPVSEMPRRHYLNNNALNFVLLNHVNNA